MDVSYSESLKIAKTCVPHYTIYVGIIGKIIGTTTDNCD